MARANSSDRAPLGGTRVLVVDDHDDARELFAKMLESAGAEVAQADSAAAALELLERAETFAVLLSDIGMPIADGYELMRRIRAAVAPHVNQMPAVAVTAFCSTNDRAKAHRAGFQDYLTKPVEAHTLVETVERLAFRESVSRD